jgi:hypothetical protein
MKQNTLLSLLVILILLCCKTEAFAQQNTTDSKYYLRLNHDVIWLFKSPSAILRAETGKEYIHGFSYAFTAGGLLWGASYERETEAEGLDMMLFAGPSFRLNTFAASSLYLYIGVTAGPAYMQYYWRESPLGTTANWAAIISPEIGIRVLASEQFMISAGTSLFYGRILSESMFESRPDSFLGILSLSTGITYAF